jgi:hypothetical protein
MRPGYTAVFRQTVHTGGLMDWVFRKSIVAGGTPAFIQLQHDVGGELQESYQIGPEWAENAPLTLEQLARARFKIPPGDTVTIIDA